MFRCNSIILTVLKCCLLELNNQTKAKINQVSSGFPRNNLAPSHFYIGHTKLEAYQTRVQLNDVVCTDLGYLNLIFLKRIRISCNKSGGKTTRATDNECKNQKLKGKVIFKLQKVFKVCVSLIQQIYLKFIIPNLYVTTVR